VSYYITHASRHDFFQGKDFFEIKALVFHFEPPQNNLADYNSVISTCVSLWHSAGTSECSPRQPIISQLIGRDSAHLHNLCITAVRWHLFSPASISCEFPLMIGLFICVFIYLLTY